MLDLPPSPIEETGPIQLKRLTLDDADAYYDLFDRNRSYITEHDRSLGRSFMTISAVAEQLSPMHERDRQHFAVLDEGEFIGSTFLLMQHNRRAEMSCWIDQGRIRRGIARQACRLLINHAIVHLDRRHFDAVIASTNTASINTVKNLGFEYTETKQSNDIYSRSF